MRCAVAVTSHRSKLSENGTFIFMVDWKQKHRELECWPMPNVMVALPNIGGAFCSTPQSLADAHY